MPRFEPTGESDEKPDSPNIVRRDIANVDGTGVFSTEVKRPDEIVKLKPKNSRFSDSVWLLAVSHWGVEGSMARDFKEWMITNPGDGYFGAIQEKFKTETPRKDAKYWPEFTEYILRSLDSEDLDEFGRFGVWVKEAGITDKTLVRNIAKEFLDA